MIVTPLDVPSLLAPDSNMEIAVRAERIPPEAFTPMDEPTVSRMSFT